MLGLGEAASIDPHWHGGFYAAGALIVGAKQTLLQTAPLHPEAHTATLSYDIETGAIVGRETRRLGCVVLKWELRLTPQPDLDPPLPPIFRFEAPPRGGR